MLSQLLEWIQRTLQHWQRGGDVSLDIKISERMRSAIDLWRVMYDGSPDWVEGSVHSLRIPSVLAAELARMVTIEMTSELSGKRGEAMNDSYQGVIRNIRHYTEWAAAFGGVCFKPYVSNGRIEVDCVQADCFRSGLSHYQPGLPFCQCRVSRHRGSVVGSGGMGAAGAGNYN